MALEMALDPDRLCVFLEACFVAGGRGSLNPAALWSPSGCVGRLSQLVDVHLRAARFRDAIRTPVNRNQSSRSCSLSPFATACTGSREKQCSPTGALTCSMRADQDEESVLPSLIR
jgi:hypothetical protein